MSSIRVGFYSRLAEIVYRRRWLVLAAWLTVSIVLAWQGSKIDLDTDLTSLLPRGTPSAENLKEYLDRFDTADVVFLSLQTEGEDAVEDLEEAADLLLPVLEETGLFSRIRYGYSEEDGRKLIARAMEHLPVLMESGRLPDFTERVSTPAIASAIARLRAGATSPMMMGPRKILAAEDPLGLFDLVSPGGTGSDSPVSPDPSTGLLLSPGGDALLIAASPVSPPQDVEFSKRLVPWMNRITGDVQVTFRENGLNVSLDWASGHLFAVQDEASIRHDIETTGVISITIIVLLFAFVLRRLRLLLVLLMPLLLSTLWTLGVARVHPGHLNVVTVAFAAILLGLGDDALTHLYLRFREQKSSGQDRPQALSAALASTGPSILAATLTSGLAFSSLMFVEFRGLSELGQIAAIGMLNLLFSVLLLFPCLLSFSRLTGVNPPPPRLPMELFVRFHVWASARRRSVLSIATLILVLAAFSATRLEFSTDLPSLRGRDDARAQLDRVLSPFGGVPQPVNLVDEGTTIEESLQQAETTLALSRKLYDEGLITGYQSVSAFLPSVAMQQARIEAIAETGIDWTRVGDDLRRALDAEGMREEFFAPFLESLQGWQDETRVTISVKDFENQEIPGLSGSAVATTLFPAPGVAPGEILERAASLAASPPGFRASSIQLVVSDLSRIIESDFRRASIIAFVAVLVIAAAAFRSLTRTLTVAVPVLGGGLLMLGGLAFVGVPINLMNLVATPLVFGLGIDFGIYMVNRHREKRDTVTVVRETGAAILLTGLTTIGGFGSLLGADFAGLQSMGWVAVLGIGGSLLTALLILPLLLPRGSTQAGD